MSFQQRVIVRSGTWFCFFSLSGRGLKLFVLCPYWSRGVELMGEGKRVSKIMILDLKKNFRYSQIKVVYASQICLF